MTHGQKQTTVVQYTYDTWGAVTNITGDTTLGELNPIRYRSYYYDNETGWYYLQSRYYDPVAGRFVNADFQINDGVLGANAFAYCNNNPVNHDDPDGRVASTSSSIPKFGSIDAAALGFADTKNVWSIKNDWEYATFIYEIKTYPLGPGRMARYQYSFFVPWTDKKNNFVGIVNQYNSTKHFYNIVAMIHTHGAYKPKYKGEEFSSDDKKIAKSYKVLIYLVTPGGLVKRYNYKTGKTTVVGGTYHDRKAKAAWHKCGRCVN